MQDMYQLKQIPSEAQIKKYIRRIVFGKNIFCPDQSFRERSSVYEGRYRCKRCRLKFSLISPTWLTGMKLSFQKFWLILWSWTTQIPVKQAMALTELGRSSNTTLVRSFQNTPSWQSAYFRENCTTWWSILQKTGAHDGKTARNEKRCVWHYCKEQRYNDIKRHNFCIPTLSRDQNCILTEQVFIEVLNDGGRCSTDGIFTKSGSLNWQARLKDCLETYGHL